jgi:hypothetical protein
MRYALHFLKSPFIKEEVARRQKFSAAKLWFLKNVKKPTELKGSLFQVASHRNTY